MPVVLSCKYSAARAAGWEFWAVNAIRREALEKLIELLEKEQPALTVLDELNVALAMGLVNTVVPLDELEAEVERWCAELLEKSPGCLEVLKASFDQEMDGYRESCVTSAAMYPDWFDMPEGKEGGAAFLAKRKPEFWRLREREADARQALIDAYQDETKAQDKES